MNLSCDITLDDAIVGFRVLCATSPAIKAQQRKKRFVCSLLPIVVFGFLGVPLDESRLGMWIIGLAGCVIVVLIFPTLQRRAMERHWRRMYASSAGKFLGPRQLVIEDRGLYSLSQGEEKTIFWTSISNVVMQPEVSPEYCILCVDTLAVLAIPRARVAAGDFDAFSQEVLRRWRLA
jgi:hypothetical protein